MFRPRLYLFATLAGLCGAMWANGAAGDAAAASGRERLVLDNGVQIEGDVLAENPGRLFLDLGFDVLAIPHEAIVTRVPAARAESPGSDYGNDLYRTEPDAPLRPVPALVDRRGPAVVLVRTPTGLGSGFLIHPEGYLVTNEHVVSGEHELAVTQYVNDPGGNVRKEVYEDVRVVALDGFLDLALLKIEGATDPFPTAPLLAEAAPRAGDPVFAIGSPLGLERTVSQGVVSVPAQLIGTRLLIQTTAEINPGNSGGPLFNFRGEVVGVNNMKVSAAVAEGLGFAIPVHALKQFLRHREAYAYDPRNPNSGFRYLTPPVVAPQGESADSVSK